MLKIRLQKVGKKNAPSYRIVLCEHTSPPQGKFIEILGFYNTRLKKKNFKKERIEYWLSQGAQSSPTVHNLLIDEGILKGIKLKAWRPKKSKKEEKKVEPPKSEAKVEKPTEGEKEEPKTEIPKEKPKTEKIKTEESKEEKIEEKVKEEVKPEEKKEKPLDKSI